MFPGVYGFHWELGHLLFLAIFFAVLLKIVGTLALGLLRSAKRLRGDQAGALIWKADFSDLPLEEKSCRHALTGRLKDRICTNAFECGECARHETVRTELASHEPLDEYAVAGLDVPSDRLYHRGHTWVKEESDGTVTIGLDSLGSRLIGKPDVVDLPRPGDRIIANGTGWRMARRQIRMRVLAPIAGEVLENGGPEQEWYLRVRSDKPLTEVRQLLTAAEAKSWMTREWERLQRLLSSPETGPTLADGGVLVGDLTAELDNARMDHIASSVFLQP